MHATTEPPAALARFDVDPDVEAIQRIPVVPQVLAAVRSLTGSSCAAIARVTPERWMTCAASDPTGFGFRPGAIQRLETPGCPDFWLVRHALVVDSVRTDRRYRSHPTPALHGFESWVSVPIVLPDGGFFGTLCAIDRRPARLEASAASTAMRLFAELVALHLHDARLSACVLEERRELENVLHQSQKMELVGQLTAGLAHDFNNLLVGIGGAFDLMERRIAQDRPADLPRHLHTGRESLRRAVALSARLLAFSRRQEAVPEAVDLNALVDGMKELMRQTMGPAIGVRSVPSRSVCRTVVDPNQLESALLNLCVNARDAMPGGGTLTVSTGALCMDADEAHRRKLAPGDYVVLRVNDTGSGMPDEVAIRVLEPFFTTKPAGKGTGLGLSMVLEFTRQAGGGMHIESRVGQGTTIVLYLACAKG